MTLWTADHQAPASVGFSRQEYLSGLPFPPLWDIPDTGLEPTSPVSPALAGGLFTTESPGKSLVYLTSSISWQKARGHAGGMVASPRFPLVVPIAINGPSLCRPGQQLLLTDAEESINTCICININSV